MNYLPRKVIKEEVNKINPEFDFDITLSHNRFNLFEDKSYVIKIKYKKFRDTYGLIIPIRRDVIRQMNRRNLRKILNYELLEINKKFSSYGGRKEIKRRSIEADREWARYIPDETIKCI